MHLDNLANLYNMTIKIFKHNSNESCWVTPIVPNGDVVKWSQYAWPPGRVMYVYNEHLINFDLLCERPKENILVDLQKDNELEVSFTNNTENTDNNFDEGYLPTPPPAKSTRVVPSPLYFQSGIRSRGRPNKTRYGAHQFNKKSSDAPIQSRAVRGRKRKQTEPEPENTPVRTQITEPNHTPFTATPKEPTQVKARKT